MLIFSKKDEFDSTIENICITQARIYVTAVRNGYDLADFSDKYLKSEFCRIDMDVPYSVWQYQDEDVCLEAILLEINRNNELKTYDENNAENDYDPYFIGYMYRYFYYHTTSDSAELSEIIPFSEMAKYSIECEDYEYDDAMKYIAAQIR